MSTAVAADRTQTVVEHLVEHWRIRPAPARSCTIDEEEAAGIEHYVRWRGADCRRPVVVHIDVVRIVVVQIVAVVDCIVDADCKRRRMVVYFVVVY